MRDALVWMDLGLGGQQKLNGDGSCREEPLVFEKLGCRLLRQHCICKRRKSTLGTLRVGPTT